MLTLSTPTVARKSESEALAVIAGLAFTGGALYILLEDVLVKGHPWTMEHALSVLTVLGAIACGHLAGTAARRWHILPALGFAALFLGATTLTVLSSIERQAETTETKTLDAEALNKALALKGAELEKAQTRLDDANRYADAERGTTCGRRCQDWEQRAKEVRGYILGLEAQIAALGPAKPVQPGAAKLAKIVALFGYDEAKTKATVILLKPLANTLVLELGAIISLAYGFGGRRSATVAKRATVSGTVSAQSETVAAPLKPKKPSHAEIEAQAVIDALERARAQGRETVSNNELADLMGVEKAEASRRVKAMNGRIRKVAAGREVAISLN